MKYDRNGGLAGRFVSGLQALITEMRRKGAGAKQIVVEAGRSVPLDGGEAGYQFPYEGDGDLFEGAKVQAVIGGRHSEGRIVSVFERQIVVSLDSHFGSHIDVCLLRIDNTAMLDALRERLDKVVKGEVTSFNSGIADSALRNTPGDTLPSIQLSQGDITLNGGQVGAAHVALENPISYIWGPPGTGKTQALSAICKSFFDAQKRVLICSNTNQAVDQVLNKLCNLLGKTNKAVDEGKILRIGRIALEELRTNWGDYVTLDGIVDRLSKDLRQRRETLEAQIEKITRTCEAAARIIEEVALLEQAQKQLASMEAADSVNSAAIIKYTEDANRLVEQVSKLSKDLQSVEGASIIARAFKRSKEAVQADLTKTRHALNDAKSKLVELTSAQQSTASRILAVRAAIESREASLRYYDRRMLEKELADADAKKTPFTTEVAEISKQLNDIAKAVMEKAMIVGATATKLFLSPQSFDGFDVVVIDEASMLMLPALFHAAGLAKERVVICGDFRQLPPIVTTDQQAILDAVGGDVFSASGITKAFCSGQTPHRAAFLDEQFRMADPICALLSTRMYGGRLHTAPSRQSSKGVLPEPFDGALTIVDTSTIGPFVNRDHFGSRYNLMHALAVRNMVLHLSDTGFANDPRTIGVCTSYSAQAKLYQRILKGANLDKVEAGTVHRYQGDEKQAMVLDIPDGIGERTVGMWLEADTPDDDGAKLFNVAISRAKEHLIVFANIEYLDEKLPERALLRGMLHDMQQKGTVVDVRDVLGYYPMLDDVRAYGLTLDLDAETLRTGLFNQKDFDRVWCADAERAKESIVIFSGFVTPQRVAVYGDLLRRKVDQGVAVRCVTRPPQHNGSIAPEDGKAALDTLEKIGCLVDTRWDIHEKTIIVDGEILWFGSLNPLSHGSATSEVMARFMGRAVASQVAAFLAIDQGDKADEAGGQIIRKENPVCPGCGGRTTYRKGKFGPYWECEQTCGWRENFASSKKQASKSPPTGDPGPCPKCSKSMVARSSSFGPFFGCSDYPRCTATIKPEAKSDNERRKKGPK